MADHIKPVSLSINDVSFAKLKPANDTISVAEKGTSRKRVGLNDPISGPNFAKAGLLELCAGSATLSYTAEKMGFFAVPVDYERNKFQSKLPTIKLNLADECSVKICTDLIDSGKIQVVTAAVPCGTASRAREIYIPGGPVPLRSEEYPYGLPDLRECDHTRVVIANRIYANTYVIITYADSKGCLCFVENPDKSYLWLLDEYQLLLQWGWFDVRFQHCRWSPGRPMRPKWTRLRTNFKGLLALEGDSGGKCVLQHQHLGWGISAK